MFSSFSRFRTAFGTATLALATLAPDFAFAADAVNSNCPRNDAGTPAAPAAAAAVSGKRVVLLRGRIDDDMAVRVNDALVELDEKEPGKAIELRINSSGGELDAGLNIFDTIKSLSSPVATVCESQCASMAGILFIAGSPGMRTMRPHAEVLLHEMSLSLEGTYSKVKSGLVSVERRQDQMMQILSDYTGHSRAKLEDLLRGRNQTYGADEAVKLGMADKVEQPKQKPPRRAVAPPQQGPRYSPGYRRVMP